MPRVTAASRAPSPLVTAAKRSMRPPASRSAMYFWWCTSTVSSTSGGRPRNSAGTSPTITVGYSTRSRHSSRRPWSSNEPAAAAARELLVDPGRALVRLQEHEALAQPLAAARRSERTVERAPARALRQEAVSARLARRSRTTTAPLRARLERVDRERHEPAVEAGPPASGSAGRTGRRPGRRRARRPSSCAWGTRARAGRPRAGRAATSAVGRPATLRTRSRLSSAGFAGSLAPLAQVRRPRRRSSSRSPGPRRSSPRRVLRDLERRAPDGLLAVGLARGQIGPRAPGAAGVQATDASFASRNSRAGRLQEPRAQLLGEAGEPGRRHLLEADLDEELSHGAASAALGAAAGVTAST